MVVDARQRHVICLEQGQRVVQQIGRDAELGFLARRDDLLMVPRADAGVEADHDPAAAFDPAERFDL